MPVITDQEISGLDVAVDDPQVVQRSRKFDCVQQHAKGVLKRKRLLSQQVSSKLIDVCTWTKGSYGWYDGRAIERTAFPLDINPFEVMGAGAMAFRDELVRHETATECIDTEHCSKLVDRTSRLAQRCRAS